MKQPLLLAPLRVEAAAIGRGARGAEIGRVGMGMEHAKQTAARLSGTVEAGRPIVLLGVGGGLSEGQHPGDVVVASSLQSTGDDSIIKLPLSAEIAVLLVAGGISCQLAPIISSPKIISGGEARVAAASQGAVAVDMESYWCATLAARHPFAVVRVLLDVPGYELFSPRVARTLRAGWQMLSRCAREAASWSPITLDTESLLEVGES